MKEFRFPTIIGVAIITLGLVGAIYLANTRTGGFLRADLSYQPKNILISNFKPDQFTVSWQTEKEAEGYLTYGETPNLGLISLDKRDLNSGKRTEFIYHYVTIFGLTTGKTYYFKIGSKGTLYGGEFSLSQNCQDFIPVINKNPFKVTLNANTPQMARPLPASGLIAVAENGKAPVSGVVTCLSLKDVLPLTDITSTTGSFIIPFFTVVKRDLTLLSQISEEAVEEIYGFGPNEEITYAKIKTSDDHPIPIMKLGGNYDFTKSTPSPQTKPEVSVTATITLKPTSIPSASASSGIVELSFPQGVVTDTLPTFRGKGKPGQVFDIKVESPEILRETVKIDNNGFWSWTPPANLTPGEHKVTITTRDESGKLNSLIKIFTVLAANPILPVSAGTPSATIAPTATLAPRATLIPTATTIPTPTLSPTKIPTPVSPTALPSPTIELPPSGISTPFFFLLTSGLLSIILGIGMTFSFKKTK